MVATRYRGDGWVIDDGPVGAPLYRTTVMGGVNPDVYERDLAEAQRDARQAAERLEQLRIQVTAADHARDAFQCDNRRDSGTAGDLAALELGGERWCTASGCWGC